MDNKTIAAISTPFGTGGIGLVRMSGPDSHIIAQQFFKGYAGRNIAQSPGYTGLLGRIFDQAGDVDEAIAFVYKAPKSYTGEDIVEFSCHGGVWILQRVLRLCLENGAEPAGPGEFTKRAFLNGKMDLAQAEAVVNLINAQADSAGRAALAARDGALSTKLKGIVENLVYQSALLAAWSDDPDEDEGMVTAEGMALALRDICGEIGSLLESYDQGRMIYEGIHTVIAGKPNVGKSTLMNVLSGTQRSIVTEIPGTTRDTVEETIRLGSVVLRLYDTAGLRQTADYVEAIGVARAERKIEEAQLILAVFDSSQPLDDEDNRFLKRLVGRPVVAVINKTDLPNLLDVAKINEIVEDCILISAKEEDGLKELENAVKRRMNIYQLDTSAPLLANERQKKLMDRAFESLEQAIQDIGEGVTLDAVNVEIDDALDVLLAITGEKVTDRVIDEVFSKFCIGK
ncbi:MAG: tRNA uridine-5-carboxymethylaminomethyl(34) synthesis GTPase MnmE [Oscillospiraceae bacterium]|jgi:tRNA modification GTPase|nr:tRNA uridine-5-carboxymethylaminomethyl(34) synthesis GTPase MnmE [Oscillospiraceae bacterium]